ncbi:MAG TPA: hypothetical protein VF867_18640 [Arthrobacter sp.]
MKPPKAPYILTAFGIALMALLVYAFVYMPKISEAADLDTQRMTVMADDAKLQAQSDNVAAKIKNLPDMETKVNTFNASFPAGPSQKDLLALILDAASATGVTVTGINPTVPTAVVPAAAAAPAAGAGTSIAAAAPAAPTPAAAAATGTMPSGPLAGVGLTINAQGDSANLLAFMQRIESLRRPFTTTEVTLTKNETGSGVLVMAGTSFLVSPLVKPEIPATVEPATK